jgi:hypothetical protein
MDTRIIRGDSRKLKELLRGTAKVQCTITSPPYFDLLDYGHKNEIGSRNRSYKQYLDDLKAVFSQVRDQTADSGTCWTKRADSFPARSGGS